MAFNYTYFLSEFPEFSAISSDVIRHRGCIEDDILSDSSWGNLRCHALNLRVAHRLALRYNIGPAARQAGVNNGSSSAIVTSKSASNASLSESSELNAFVRSDDPIWADFGRTEYGLEYLGLLSELMARGQVILSRGVGDAFY